MSTRWLRIVALAEAFTYVLLLGAVVAKRVFEQPAGVTVVGPIHGIVFLAYFVLVVFAREEQAWSLGETAAVLGAAVIPFGGYLVERRLRSAAIGSERLRLASSPAVPAPDQRNETRSHAIERSSQ